MFIILNVRDFIMYIGFKNNLKCENNDPNVIIIMYVVYILWMIYLNAPKSYLSS